MMRFLCLTAVLVAFAVILPAASVAGSHQTFSDATGDDSQGLAPDIAALDVTSTDDGGITFKVLINEQGGQFFVGDTLEVLINSDNNASTGNQGAESGLFVFTSTGRLDFEFCNFNANGTRDCSTYASLTESPSLIFPASGFSCPVMIRKSVVLPAPLGPITPTIAPAGILNERSSMSCRSP